MNTQYRHCGRKLTPSELVEFLTDQHCAMVDDPIMLWMAQSLEEMGDVISWAISCAEDEPLQPEALAAARASGDGQDAFDNWRQS